MSAPASQRYALLAVLLLLAVSGLVVHLRLHPFAVPSGEAPGGTVFRWPLLWATLLSAADAILVTLLFLSRRTAVYGYVLNGFLVIYGTVLMGHFSLVTLAANSAPPADYLFRSTFSDICVAGADFLVGKLLWEAWLKDKGTVAND